MPDNTDPVPGIGDPNADIMFVGEALGENEAIQERPFVGVAGQLLTKMLKEVGITREECYITNVVHCRPTTNGGKKNRAPTEEEITACKGWLWKEMQTVKPKIIVTLGKVPTYTLLHSKLKKTFKMGAVAGNVYDVDYIDSHFIPCWHPSYLLQHGKDKIEETKDILKLAKGMVDELQ